MFLICHLVICSRVCGNTLNWPSLFFHNLLELHAYCLFIPSSCLWYQFPRTKLFYLGPWNNYCITNVSTVKTTSFLSSFCNYNTHGQKIRLTTLTYYSMIVVHFFLDTLMNCLGFYYKLIHKNDNNLIYCPSSF